MSIGITSEELKSLLLSEELYALIDVREKTEFNRGQIFRATNVPRREIEFRVPHLVPITSIRIVLCDEDETRALLAANTLKKAGYERVEVLKGGLKEWREAGNYLVEGVNVPSKVFGEVLASRDKPQEIVPQELKAWLDRGEDFIIIEVRPPEEVLYSGSLMGAINIQGVQLPLVINDLVKYGKKIVVTCAGRTRGIIAVHTLKMMGINVLDLKNGTQGWVLSGYDLQMEIPEGPEPSGESRGKAKDFAMQLLQTSNLNLISLQELDKLKQENSIFYLFDVRTTREYSSGHIPGSISLPGGQAIQCADEFVAVRNGTIIFACDDMIRSVITAYWYKEMGFRKVYILDGGIQQFIKLRAKLEMGPMSLVPLGFNEAGNRTNKISVIELNSLLSNHSDVKLLTVDDSRQFRSGHIPGALWLSRSILEQNIKYIIPQKETPIVLICREGINSIFAGLTLMELGYKDVRVLDGGTNAWKREGLALESGSVGIIMEFDDVLPRSHERSREQMIKYLNWEEQLHSGPRNIQTGTILHSK